MDDKIHHYGIKMMDARTMMMGVGRVSTCQTIPRRIARIAKTRIQQNSPGKHVVILSVVDLETEKVVFEHPLESN